MTNDRDFDDGDGVVSCIGKTWIDLPANESVVGDLPFDIQMHRLWDSMFQKPFRHDSALIQRGPCRQKSLTIFSSRTVTLIFHEERFWDHLTNTADRRSLR